MKLSDIHVPTDASEVARSIASIEESARELHVRAFGEGAQWQNHLLRHVAHIKWILAALLAIQLWRLF